MTSIADRHRDLEYLLRWADAPERNSANADLVDLAKLARDAIEESCKLRTSLLLACVWLDAMATAAEKQNTDVAAKVQADVALIRKTLEQTA